MALIRFGGGSGGIKEYLEEGKKQGRELSRDEIDERIVLEGDLDICDKIIQSRDTEGERYDHVTLSFKEDDVSEETLRAIAADFKEFALAAYGDDELYLYAEAHMPRTATEEKWNAESKRYETVDRHPHIHFVIPKTNLVTGGHASAFELLRSKYATKDATMDFTDAFQEHINKKYGLASPKDAENRRTGFTGKADILSRVKGDVFKGRNRESLALIRDAMVEQNIESPEAFKKMLKGMGVVSTGHGKDGDYLQVKLPGQTQNVRLKDYQFSNEFLAKPMAEKLAFYDKKAAQLSEQGAATAAAQRAELLDKWQDRAREIKYLSPSSKFFKELYAKATEGDKRLVLDKLEAQHYAKLEKEYGYVYRGNEGTLEGRITAGLDLTERGQAGRMDVSAAIARNLGESSRNFEALAVNPGIDADAIRERLGGAAENVIERERASRIRGRSSGLDGNGIEDIERGGVGHGDQREASDRAVRDNLRAANANHQVLDGLGNDFWEAAIANRASLEDDATARRYEAYGNGKLNSIYLRTTDELREADSAGRQIIAEPGAAITALTWSQSTFDETRLERHLLKNTADQEQFDAALKAVLAHPDLVVHHDEERGLLFTSREIVAIEARLVERAARMDGTRVSHGLERDPQQIIEDKTMNQGQRTAFELLCSDKQIAVVNGAAGTGKSYVLAAMREAYEREGFAVHGAILQGKTAEDLERDSGIQSRTVARMLIDIKNGAFRLNQKSVLVVDEAGMVGSRDIEKLMAHVEQAGARIRLVGDAKQLSAVEYGNAFVEISQRTEVASLTEIMRQKTEWMRSASEKFAVHDISGLKDYHDHGHVHLADTTKDAQLAIVEKWNMHRAEQPDQSRIVLSHTNSARLELNDMMRAELKKEGKLQDEVDVITHRGIVKMAVGEQVMFTSPDKNMGVKNGTTGVISEISLGGTVSVELANGKTAQFNASGRGKENGNEVDYAYAVTVHKSQGMTVDQSFVLAENSMTKDNLYVAMTRHKHDVELVASAEQFATIDDLVKGLDRVGQKEFSAEDGKDWTSAQRPEDSKIGQMLADINAEKVIMLAAQQAPYKEIAANLEAQRVLDYVSKTHGIDLDKHTAITDEEGRQRIQTGDTSRDVAGFLVKEMHLDYKSQAAPILKQCYGEQLAQVYSTQRYEPGQEIDQVLKEEFTDYRKSRDETYKADKKALDEEMRAEKAVIDKSEATAAEKKHSQEELSLRIKASKAELKKEFEKPEAAVYKDYLAEHAPASDKHLQELWRVAVTQQDRERLAAIETDRATVRAGAKPDIFAEARMLVQDLAKQREEKAEQAARELERRNAELDKQDSGRASNNDRHEPIDPRIFADAKMSEALRMTWAVNTKTGDVAYHIDGKPAFTDHGERVSFGDGKDADAIETGLKLTAQKYGGTVQLNGTDEFKQRAVEVAAERGVNIQFANKELSVYHDAYKHQLQVEREKEEARQRAEREHTSEHGHSSGR